MTKKGFTKIDNQILENLIAANLNGTEFAVCLFIIRKTIGFQKESDAIPLIQFQEATKKSKRMIQKSLKNLVDLNIINVIKRGSPGHMATAYNFNTNFTIRKQVNKMTREQNDTCTIVRETGEQKFAKQVNNSATSKESISKEKKERLFSFFKNTLNQDVKLTEASEQKIEDRLKSFTLEDLKTAVQNFAAHDWYFENHGHRSPAWFFATDDRVQEFINLKPKLDPYKPQPGETACEYQLRLINSGNLDKIDMDYYYAWRAKQRAREKTNN